MILEVVMGVVLGFAAGVFGFWSLYRVIGLLKGADAKSGTAVTYVAFLAKFPVIGLLGWLCFRQSVESLVAFTSAIVMVYFALVWRAYRSDLYRD